MKNMIIASLMTFATIGLSSAEGPSTGAKIASWNCPKVNNDGCISTGKDPAVDGGGDRKIDSCAKQKDSHGNLVSCGTVQDAISNVPSE